ncbi:MAG: Uma2 family endonuclease [Bryobacteraceae bacterium]
MQTAVRLMTFEEFQQLPDPIDGTYLELHQGEAVKTTFPAYPHVLLQFRLRQLLEPRLASFGLVFVEFPFRALSQHEARRADLGVVSHARSEDAALGAPEIAIEVLSPSNTRAEIAAKRDLCLANGSLEFWTVDPRRKTVMISKVDGSAVTYRHGDSISFAAFGGQDLPVSIVFEGGGATRPDRS